MRHDAGQNVSGSTDRGIVGGGLTHLGVPARDAAGPESRPLSLSSTTSTVTIS